MFCQYHTFALNVGARPLSGLQTLDGACGSTVDVSVHVCRVRVDLSHVTVRARVRDARAERPRAMGRKRTDGRRLNRTENFYKYSHF